MKVKFLTFDTATQTHKEEDGQQLSQATHVRHLKPANSRPHKLVATKEIRKTKRCYRRPSTGGVKALPQGRINLDKIHKEVAKEQKQQAANLSYKPGQGVRSIAFSRPSKSVKQPQSQQVQAAAAAAAAANKQKELRATLAEQLKQPKQQHSSTVTKVGRIPSVDHLLFTPEPDFAAFVRSLPRVKLFSRQHDRELPHYLQKYNSREIFHVIFDKQQRYRYSPSDQELIDCLIAHQTRSSSH